MAILTILLPTYQGASYVEDQLESILTQRFSDFRLISIDDGSTDGTQSMMTDIARRDSRVTLIPAVGNAGHRTRLRELAAIADTDLISVADQDDVWAPDKLDRLIAGLGDNAAAYGMSRVIDAQGRDQGYTLFDAMPPAPTHGDRLAFLFKPMASAHAMILRRAYFSDASLRRSQPFDWLQSLDAVFGDGIVYVADSITFHRIHGENQSNAAIARQSRRIGSLIGTLRRNRNRRLTERWMVCHAFEHLGYSTLIPTATSDLFRRLHVQCVKSWFDVGRTAPLRDHALAEVLLDELGPLAGSEADLANARGWIAKLSTAPGHPATIARDVARTIVA